jgi:hypothetical protein
MTSILNSLICKKCNEEKDISKFAKTKTGYRLSCNKCRHEPYKKQAVDRQKKWRENNKEEAKKLRRKNRISQRTNRPWMVAMKSILHRKEHRIHIKDSEYSYDEFKKHIEFLFDENMSWDNWGDYWDVDHIKPRREFTYEQRYECHSLSNLQPLEKNMNRYIKK